MSKVRFICFIIAAVGGLILFLVPIIRRKRSDVPRWTYGLVALLGLFGAGWAALGLSEWYYGSQLTPRAYHLLERYRMLCGGVAIGLFMAWCVSGEFVRGCKRRSFWGL